jgi:sugar lactone lactonase YvrE
MAIRSLGLTLSGVLLALLSCRPAPPEPVPEILVQGAPIHGTNGIMFDNSGRLYIASALGREIVVMDPGSGEILERIGPDRGVDTPDDLHFGPDGSLYWTSIMTGEVGRLTPEGVATGQMIQPGVNPVTFSDDGRLFVGLDIIAGGLYELDPGFETSPRPIYEGLGTNGMDWGPDGFLYAPVEGNVMAVDVGSGETRSVAGGEGLGTIKFDSNGRLHGLDWSQPRVVRLDVDTGSRETVAALPPGADNLAFDSGNRLFVSSFWNGSVLEVLPDGTTRTVSPGGLIAPGGLGVHARPDGGESVFVADVFTVREFDGLTGNEVEQRSAWHFTKAVHGDLLVSTSWISATGVTEVRDLLTNQTLVSYTDFNHPLNAIMFQGDLVVADVELGSGFTRVVRASTTDPSRREVLMDSGAGLGLPTGLAATEHDLWVADREGGSVYQLVLDGEVLDVPLAVSQGLAAPEGMAVSADGALLAAETGASRLIRIDPASGEVSTLAGGLALDSSFVEGWPQTWLFSGVAVGPSGTIYLSNAGDNQLLVLRPEVP